MVIDTNNIGSSGGANSTRRSTAPVTPVTTKTTEPTTAEAAVTGSKDNVVLSAEGQNLSRLQAKINSSSDVNYDRVAALKQAIAEGRFEINPERIAENMLNQDELFN